MACLLYDARVLNDIHNINLPSELDVVSASKSSPVNPGVEILLAVAHPDRWAILRELVFGIPLSVQELAAKVECTPNQTSKHMMTLRAAGAVVTVERAGEDGRKQFYSIPEEYLRIGSGGEKEIDYGGVVLRYK